MVQFFSFGFYHVHYSMILFNFKETQSSPSELSLITVDLPYLSRLKPMFQSPENLTFFSFYNLIFGLQPSPHFYTWPMGANLNEYSIYMYMYIRCRNIIFCFSMDTVKALQLGKSLTYRKALMRDLLKPAKWPSHLQN